MAEITYKSLLGIVWSHAAAELGVRGKYMARYFIID